ncbi:tetratricopeptide repeat protein 36 isoform X4 [Anopheles darlingi]|uniref:tetratricopeptide repeat protein 36 isoform X4 n=1 Tax=Anopheles darlingi TaxID=43151 RepID=UPI0021002106|nr:tetratricopeptide repeat protein 36 isoform X4 [Anopheles darlingi]
MNRLKKEDLSERDRQVLESIFNPSQIGGEEYLLQDEEKHLTDPQDADDVDDPRVKESQRLEIEAIALTIAGKLSEALEMLGKSIETAPHRPAPWNNRAQVHCLLGQEINALKDVERALELSEVFKPCGAAILTSPRFYDESGRSKFRSPAIAMHARIELPTRSASHFASSSSLLTTVHYYCKAL